MTRATRGDATTGRRWKGDEGAGYVAAIALLFAATFLGLVWLARDVDRGISNRSAAQSIAFQAARSGAQATDVSEVRAGGPPLVDAPAAQRAARATAERLFAGYAVDGEVTRIEIDGRRVLVEVSILDGSVRVTGTGIVRAERAP